MDLSRFQDRNADRPGGYRNWQYTFPNGHTASVIVDPHSDQPFRFEVLTSDPTDPATGVGGLTTTEVEAKLPEVAGLPAPSAAAS